MPYVEYLKMTPEQQQQVKDHLLTKNMTEEELPSWAFLVKEDGVVTRRKGMHQPSARLAGEWDRAARELQRELLSAEIPGDPGKGSIRHYLSGARYNFSNK